ncbi:MAG TPA: hypothetical protein IAB84_08335 [Candidatus Choladousia intestinigallinarum]|nr:hypothetical protein [Candidatus Choladousia intestinigallinarum]
MGNRLGLVKKILLHTVVLLAVFVGAVICFEGMINQITPDTAEAMENSTFPLVYMRNNGVSYNCLHGYAYEMDVNYIRDTVTVLDSDHVLDIQIQPFDTEVDGVSYEVLSLDGSQSLENTKVTNLTEEDGYLYASLTIQNYMLMNQEYILKIQVTAGGREHYYYTRFLLEDGLHLSSYLDFVTGFYEKCVNKTDQETLGTVVEPDETTDQASTLANMDIHDSVSQLMWGELNPQIFYKPTPSLVDINGTTASFVLEYRISAVGEEGVTEIYNVKEFYRLRYTDTRVFLLDFTRTTDETFNTDKTVLTAGGILLGITSDDVEYKFDEDYKTVAFAKENELWVYKINGGKLARVFGFPQSQNMDYRDFYDKNNIKILSTDQSGNVWYCVSGYMNRGAHEGENGIALYYYEDASATSEEILFVQTMESYDMLKLDTNSLVYVTDDQEDCYLLLEGIVYRINLQTREYEAVLEQVNAQCHISSASNRYFAWLEEGERYNSQTLRVMDFETGTVREVTCSDQERIRPVAFMGEDLVYGKALASDIDLSHEGSEKFPMYSLTILNEEGEEVRTYQQDGIYIMDVEASESMLTLTRASRQGTEYVQTTEDYIVSTESSDEVVYGVTTEVSDKKQAQILLRVGTEIDDENPQVVSGRMLIRDENRTVTIPVNENRESLFYVYAGGSLENVYITAAEAIIQANEKVGVVINDKKEFVWERGNRGTSYEMDVEDVPEAFRRGTMDVQTLEEAMGTEVLDLTGCTLDMVLYFVGQGRAVLANTPEGTVTITGYDEYNTILLDPGSDETYYYGLNDSTALFEEGGNQFLSYVELEQ